MTKKMATKMTRTMKIKEVVVLIWVTLPLQMMKMQAMARGGKVVDHRKHGSCPDTMKVALLST